MLNTVLSLTNLSLLQDIEKQTIETYEVTEITSTALKIKSADKELQPTEQTQTTCTRIK
ncbi:hypothetical protein GCM10009007_14360 [Formosimonas limnophila]|uniref:Uncharacterized protein n=1 Tax=Formosimonas limnophila TaxID=1384487 RepID=A0A8J3CNE8_9BURK|nr:hypothetical protein [Formosimonas limnophila]GHA74475.1 hypothetical protein GCM10009007_14360 [Formosimonas limnophila]